MNDISKTIGYADLSWNPVTGCLHRREYCYAAKIAHRFDAGFGEANQCGPIYHHELTEPVFLTDRKGKPRQQPFPFGFEPTLHLYRLDEPARKCKPSTIFVCDMGDLFGYWVPQTWQNAVFDACEAAPQHRYLFLTKNPARLSPCVMAWPYPGVKKHENW